MHAIRSKRERQIDIVVDDEWDAVGAGKLHQDFCFRERMSCFSSILQESDAALQRPAHLLDQLLAINAVGRDRIQAAQLHCSKNLLGMNCPAPGAKAAASACQVNSSASRTASGTEAPLASAAAI